MSIPHRALPVKCAPTHTSVSILSVFSSIENPHARRAAAQLLRGVPGMGGVYGRAGSVPGRRGAELAAGGTTVLLRRVGRYVHSHAGTPAIRVAGRCSTWSKSGRRPQAAGTPAIRAAGRRSRALWVWPVSHVEQVWPVHSGSGRHTGPTPDPLPHSTRSTSLSRTSPRPPRPPPCPPCPPLSSPSPHFFGEVEWVEWGEFSPVQTPLHRLEWPARAPRASESSKWFLFRASLSILAGP